ncbi:uncharacterized protein isoform X2 [Rhodnius prolixus]|uniref:uncharacterized protein isoform X2 n=1 Tax=Rhodnius prolixus TaxID=13249 RepID=UPI003D18BF05
MSGTPVDHSAKPFPRTDEVYMSSWFAFESMVFLWDKKKIKPSQNTVSKESIKQEEIPVRTEEEKIPQEISQGRSSGTNWTTSAGTKRPLAPTSIQRHSKKKNTISLVEPRIEKFLQNSATSGDECFHFGNWVASKLRSYKGNIRCAIESEITNVFVRAGEGYYGPVAE